MVVLGLHVTAFALTDTVFPGACASHRLRPYGHSLDGRFNPGDLVLVVAVKTDQRVEIAVAYMADDRPERALFVTLIKRKVP